MNMFFVGKRVGGMPPDSDDIGQSAYVGDLIVQACSIHREGSLFKSGDSVSVRNGVKLRIGRFVLDSSSGSAPVVEVGFDPRPELVDGEMVVTGWVARLKGAQFFIKQSHLQLAS